MASASFQTSAGERNHISFRSILGSGTRSVVEVVAEELGPSLGCATTTRTTRSQGD
jgi:hypothetical protein